MILNQKKNKTTIAITEIEFFDGLQNAILLILKLNIQTKCFAYNLSAPMNNKIQSNVLQFLREDSYNINNYYIDHIFKVFMSL